MIEAETTAADLCSRDGFPRPHQALPRRVASQQNSSQFRLTVAVRSQTESAPCRFQCYQFEALTNSGELQWTVKEACLKCGRIDFAKERANTVSAGCSSIRQIKSCVQPVCLFARPASHRLGPSASEIMAAMEIAMMFSTE